MRWRWAGYQPVNQAAAAGAATAAIVATAAPPRVPARVAPPLSH